MIFMVGGALSALSMVIVPRGADGKRASPLGCAAAGATIHDLGKLLLAFLMLWAYMHISQFIITWSGNLPEEITWYVRPFSRRLAGSWPCCS
jgi:uncharacterized membrane protein